MNKKFINSMLNQDFPHHMANSIQIISITKDMKDKFFAIRLKFLNPDDSMIYIYLDEKMRNEDLKLFEYLLSEGEL